MKQSLSVEKLETKRANLVAVKETVKTRVCLDPILRGSVPIFTQEALVPRRQPGSQFCKPIAGTLIGSNSNVHGRVFVHREGFRKKAGKRGREKKWIEQNEGFKLAGLFGTTVSKISSVFSE